MERALRAIERAKADALRAEKAAQRSNAADAKRAEKEAREAHSAQRQAEVDLKNSEVEQLAEDLASILSSTIDVDDYVELASLQTVPVHPPFDRPDLEVPVPMPAKPVLPARPVQATVAPPSGIFSFLSRRRYEEAVERANAEHTSATEQWQSAVKLAQLRWGQLTQRLLR